MITKIFHTTLKNWIKDDPFTLSAATAYYAIFSMPGLLVMVMAIASIFFDQQHVENQIMSHLEAMIGADATNNINNAIDHTQTGNKDIWAIAIGLATLFFGATGLFIQLQRSLNHIWEVEVKKSAGIFKFIRDRFISFGLIVAVGFLLLISLSLTAMINILGDWLTAQISPMATYAITIFNLFLSLGIITILFSLIFKILPDAQIRWKHALRGGLVSAILFNIGEHALSYYFKIAEPASAFGAAGSMILLMIWVFYSCMILFIGAEFTKNYAEFKTGLKVKASDIAKKKNKLKALFN